MDPSPPTDGPWADSIVDELLPDELDWRHLVRTYPLPAILLAGAGGFLLARSRGEALVAALSAFAVREVTKNLQSLLGEEIPGVADP